MKFFFTLTLPEVKKGIYFGRFHVIHRC